METTESITRHVELDLTTDELWHSITDGEALEGWLGESVDVDVRPGGAGRIVDDGVVRQVDVDDVDPGRGWSFRWQAPDDPLPSRVTFLIAPRDDGGSVLTITETLTVNASASAHVSAGRRIAWEARIACLWAHTMAFARLR